MDRLGTRVGYTLSLIVWSLAAAAHAFADSVSGFAIARFALGIGESGNFPAAIKTVAEWFPKKERAFATGIFNAGSNVGAIVAPLVVPIHLRTGGWQPAFIVTGLAGLIWVFFWWPLYRRPQEHPQRLARKSWRTSKAIRPIRRSTSPGSTCSRSARPGPSPSASS